MSGDEQTIGRRMGRLLVPLLLLAAVLVAVGVWAVNHFDPFFEERPDYRESKELFDAARKGPLTDAQFDRAAELIGTAQPAAQSLLMTVLELEVSRAPARREAAIRAIEGMPASTPEKTKWAAAIVVRRLKEPAKPPADPGP